MTSAHTSSGPIPGPQPAPLLKHRINVFRFAKDPVGQVIALHRRYGPVVTLTTNTPRALVFAFGEEFNRQVLSNPQLFCNPGFLSFPEDEDFALKRLNTTLAAMNGAHHKQHRRFVQPAFHREQVAGYYRNMVQAIESCLTRWPGDGTLNIFQEMKYLTLVVATKILFGIDTRAEADRFGQLTTRWLNVLFNPLTQMARYDLPGLPYRNILRVSEELDAVYQAMIDQKRASKEPQPDVLATLIQINEEDSERLNDAELIGHAHSLFVAGHDSTASSASWALFLLAQHPRIYADLLDELEGELHGGVPSLEQLGRLPLLDSVVKETLRLLTPSPVMRRKTTAPCNIGGYDVSADTPVMLSPYITHRNPELYPEPQRFRPERWANLNPSTYQYLPFGAGVHMCVGSIFAQLELKLVLAAVVQRYRLSIVPNAEINGIVRAFLAPRGGLPMHVVPQDRQFRRVPVQGDVCGMVDLDGDE
jgi:cytochrome P450